MQRASATSYPYSSPSALGLPQGHGTCWVLGLLWVFSFALFLTGSYCVAQAGLEIIVLLTLNSDPLALCAAGSHGASSTQLPCLSPACPSALILEVNTWGSPI